MPASLPNTSATTPPETKPSAITGAASQPEALSPRNSPDQGQMAHENVGEKLRSARLQKGLELASIRQRTKISSSNLQAMEEGRYHDLPAISFCRGFYKLYAKTVDLDPEKVISQFELEYSRHPRKKRPTFSFSSRNKEVEEMAGKPSLLASSSFGVILLILLFFGAFLCWFFSWDPAAFLSQRLRNLTPNSYTQTLLRSTTDNNDPSFAPHAAAFYATPGQGGENPPKRILTTPKRTILPADFTRETHL